MKTISVLITKTGEVTIKTSGFRGEECMVATRDLENMLGTKVYDTPTEEFYQQAEVRQNA